MSTITTIQSTDLITNSRSDINSNFSALNTDKMETSVLDTDTALAANSDAKVASQKAVKTYIDTSGGANASTSVRGIVEEATVAEIGAGTAAGGTAARLFINPSSTVGTSAGAGDVGKLPRLNASGFVDTTFIPITVASGSTTHTLNSTVSTTIAHGLGIIPRLIKITAVTGTNNLLISFASSVYSNSSQQTVNWAKGAGANTEARNGNSPVLYTALNTDAYQTYTITVDATNITLAWASTSSPTAVTANINWEAYI